jgi:hypothetical protein
VPRVLNIVVDADVARASGRSEHPASSNSRKLLDEIMSYKHIVPMCSTLRSEWRKHNSLYAKKWFASMIARKKIKFVQPNCDVKDYILLHVPNGKVKSIAIKDAHLIDIALNDGLFVASNDDNARKAFCTISATYKNIQSIIWVNSINDQKFITKYLSKKCTVPNKFYLG